MELEQSQRPEPAQELGRELLQVLRWAMHLA